DGVRYSHIINPVTGLGLTESIQDTIIGPNATTTDGLDTTVNVLGVQRGLALVESTPGVAALIFTQRDGRSESFASPRFKIVPFRGINPPVPPLQRLCFVLKRNV